MACITPMHIRNKITGQMHAVPCGKCPQCYTRRVSGWSFRLMQQSKVSDSSLFITLTYDSKHVPISKNGFMSLNKRDVQLFFKRLRKSHVGIDGNAPKPIKYYAVGEYGGRTSRPHYHLIIFNARIETIQLAWDLGNVHYGQLTEASVGYTLKYMCKDPYKPKHQRDDRKPLFALMSKGLGKNYLTPQMVNWHKNDLRSRVHVNLEGGKKASMPRYYKDKIYTEQERIIVAAEGKRLAEEKQRKLESEGGETFFRDQAEGHMAEFKKFFHNLKNRDQR